MINLSPCRLLMACAILAALPARADLRGGGLEGGAGLNEGGERGLTGGSLQSGRLEGRSLKSSRLQPAKLQSAKPQQGADRLNPKVIKLKAAELAEGGLGVEKIQGAVSTIPRTQVGELLYDVAGVLWLMEGDMTDVAVGYYMAVLADPQGERHDDAFKRLMEIFLDKDLEHERAVRLYDSGLETMKGLVGIKIGLTPNGHQSGLRTLQEVKAAYQLKRRRDMPKETDADLDVPKEAQDGPVILEGYKTPISEMIREDVGKMEEPSQGERGMPPEGNR
jgi:hypothetical protein